MKNLSTRRAMQRIRQSVQARMVAGDFGPAVGDACNPPDYGAIKYAAGTVTVPAAVLGVGGEATVSITTPGSFCPLQMYIVSDEIDSIFVGSIKNGLEEQIIPQTISGQPGVMLLPATMFGTENHCCPHLCMHCLCKPGVPFEVKLGNIGVTPADVTVVLVGVYTDLYPGPTTLAEMPAACEPHNTKFIPIAVNLSPGETETVHIETPGKFCGTGMFLQISGDDSFVEITSIKAGIKQQIILGGLPGPLFTISNKCCSLQCFDCLCAPGYPLEITFHNKDSEGAHIVIGGLVGAYDEVC